MHPLDPAIEMMPAAQFTHDDMPADDEYVPATQFTQLEDDEAPVDPREVPARQLVQAEFPVDSEYMPVEQLRQAVAPLVLTNMPVPQLVQADADDPEYIPEEHSVQASDNTAPAASRTVPAGHPIHAVAPVSVW